jgi:hypothetical protein
MELLEGQTHVDEGLHYVDKLAKRPGVKSFDFTSINLSLCYKHLQ